MSYIDVLIKDLVDSARGLRPGCLDIDREAIRREVARLTTERDMWRAAASWTPITEKFPPHDVGVVFAIALPGGYWDAQTGKRVNYDDVPMFWNETMKRQITHATHWLELPEPPEGEATP